MPVRVKSRALALQKPDELEREWEHLRYSLASLVLANSQLSKMTITDVERGKRVSIRSRIDQYEANEVDIGRIGSVLAQSGLLASRAMDTWHVLSATVPDLTVRAAISTVPSPSKKLQFISLGNEPVLPRNGSNMLFNEVNRLISLSEFGSAGTPTRITSVPSPSPVLGRSETSMSGRSWAKPVNKWPMFYIRVDTSSAQSLCGDDEDITSDSEKSLQRIIDVLGVMIVEFLKQQNLRPRGSKRQGRTSGRGDQANVAGHQSAGRSLNLSQEGAGRSTEEAFDSRLKLPKFQRPQAVNSGQHFNSWSRVKSAKDSTTQMSPAEDPNHANTTRNDIQNERFQSLLDQPRSGTDQEPVSDRSILSHHHSVRPASSLAIHREAETERKGTVSDAPTNQHVSWIDPHTGKPYLINSRTGQTLDSKSSSLGPRLRSGSLFAAPQTLAHSEEPRKDDSASTKNLWVDNLLNAWDNPTFSRTEMPVSNLDISTSYPLNAPRNSHSCLHDIGSLDAAQVSKFRGKLRRQTLADAAIISQVDQKFILAKMDVTAANDSRRDPDNVLVLVDQHAADERCRVEQLFEDMFLPMEESRQDRTVRMTDVAPIIFNVSSTERTLFRKYFGFFGDWGINYSIEPSAHGGTICVSTLPVLIAERCRLEPDMIVDLLRREIWTREEDDRGGLGSKTSLRKSLSGHGLFSSREEETTIADDAGSPHSWVHKMSGCPQGIIDLLNSRACRGAIMFNDPLSLDECRTLVTRLAQCAFPFQCAHGRPSMIPILDLRAQAEYDHSASDASIIPHDCYENNDLGFSEAFTLRYGN